MKILFVTHGPDMYGANRCLLDLLDQLKQYNFHPVVLVPDQGPLLAALELRQIEYIQLPYYRWAYTKYLSKGYWLLSQYQRQNKKYLKLLRDRVQEEAFDMIYSNNSVIDIGAQLAEQLQIPHIWHIREFGELDYNQVFYRGRKYFDQWVNKSKLVLIMSKAIDDAVLQNITAPKVVLHDGIITKQALQELAINPHEGETPFTFLIIGTIRKSKGQHLALRAFHQVYQKHKNIQLLIAGDGRKLFTRQLKQFVKKQRLGNHVHFMGFIANPYNAHLQANVTLMCSQAEGMGRVTLESMAVGNPVIGFNSGGTAELIEHEEDGFLFDGSIDKLAHYMNYMIEHPVRCKEMGLKGRKKIEQQYTMEEKGKVFAKLLKEALE